MTQSLEIYNQMDWWNPDHSLLKMAPFKLGYFCEKIGSLAGLHVLDVGCGGGILAEGLAKQGAHVTGIDPLDGALAVARKHAAAGGLQIRYELGTAEKLPFGDRAFDAVVCADCLEHVDDLGQVIAESSRVLRPGGVFCYDTFNRNVLSRILVAWLVEWRLRREYRRMNVSHGSFAVHDWKKFIKPEELTGLLGRHGLKNGEMKGILPGRHGFRLGSKPRVAYIGYARKE